MKKSCLILLPLLALPTLLSACSSKGEKVKLTYGNYAAQDIDSLVELSTDDLFNRLCVDNETLILATYNDIYSDDCLCWSTFRNVIVNYINKYHNQVYLFSTKNCDDSLKELGLKNEDGSKPGLRVYQGKKKVTHFYYDKAQDKKIFEDISSDYMNSELSKYVLKPSLYYVDTQYLDDKIAAENGSFSVLFMRNGCGDCKYVIPNVILPYFNKNKVEKELLLLDLQPYYDLAKRETASEEEKAQYQALKDHYYLSESSSNSFGYEQGVVPTMQYYENGALKDASVFFNDSVAQKEDGSFYVSKSFYSEDRSPKLSYLKDAKIKTVLQGMELDSANVLQTKSGSYYWSQSDASKYHTPLLKAYLDYYLL